MITLTVGKYEFFVERHETSVSGFFRCSTSHRGEAFIDVSVWSLTVTNKRKIDAYFANKGGRNVENIKQRGGGAASNRSEAA
jgi:hypothetical protein